MTRKLVLSHQFQKDVILAKKRGFDISVLNDVVLKIARGESLDPKFKDHSLLGNYHGFRECHIKPNWLLIYRIDDEEIELFLFRTGTHSDLFK